MAGKREEVQAVDFVWSDDETTVQEWGFNEIGGGLGDIGLVACAWCLAEAGIEPDSGSHGICARHAELEYQRYRAARK